MQQKTTKKVKVRTNERVVKKLLSLLHTLLLILTLTEMHVKKE
jgi:hypothetical protein